MYCLTEVTLKKKHIWKLSRTPNNVCVHLGNKLPGVMEHGSNSPTQSVLKSILSQKANQKPDGFGFSVESKLSV